jgi:glycine C-acetyltransferase
VRPAKEPRTSAYTCIYENPIMEVNLSSKTSGIAPAQHSAENNRGITGADSCLRNRDLVAGSPDAEHVYEQYLNLAETRDIELLGRVFHASSERSAHVSLASSGSAGNAASRPKTVINLGSSDYAGLNRHPRIIKAATQALRAFGNGSTGGRLLNGTTELHLQLEQKLAVFLGMEDALTYNSGYCANLSTFSTVCSKDDVVLTDILNHKSITDGLKLGGATVLTYLHNCIRGSARSVEALLRSLPREKRKFVVTDGIFSVDGDVARLDEIVALAGAYNAFVIVDEAHAIGAYGPHGRGSVAHYRLEKEVDLITGVLSKGLPGIGGFVAGSKRTIDLLRYGSNGYIFSTSLPPATVAGLIEAIAVLEEDPSIQKRVHWNAGKMREGLKDMGLDTLGSDSAVIPVLMPDVATTMRFTRLLHEAGVYVNAALAPVVSARQPRLRLNISAQLEEDQLTYALHAFRRCAHQLGLGHSQRSLIR